MTASSCWHQKISTTGSTRWRRKIAEKLPGRRWCLSPKCRGGQVHERLIQGSCCEKDGGEIHQKKTEGDIATPNTGPANDTVTSAKIAIALMNQESDDGQDDNICIPMSAVRKHA